MPFTPLHMGAGILCKSILQGSFSLMVLGWSQIVMDIQPLAAILTGHGELHGFTHTYIGATLIAIISALSGKYLAEYGLRLIKYAEFIPINWLVAFCSAAIGTYSHIVLDSIMHADMEPFWPWSAANGLRNTISMEHLHWLCISAGIIGASLYFGIARLRVKYHHHAHFRHHN